MKTRILPEMTWAAIKENYYIGTLNVDGKAILVDKLSEAIECGEIDALVERCAKALYAGDTHAALINWSKNLSSQKTNMNKKEYFPSKALDEKRLTILTTYTSTHIAKTASGGRNPGKSYWAWTMEEILAVDLKDIKLLDSIYNNMASKKSKYPDDVEGDVDFANRFAKVSELRSTAKKLAKQEALVTPELLTKLTKGTGTKLNADETALLADLLKKML